jgi:transglutaminase-like putative cysteine protease
MRLEIRHVTTYRYSESVEYEIQTLRLTPRAHEGAAILRWKVRGDRNRTLPAFLDGMGNLVHTNTIARPHALATIAAEGLVETRAMGGLVRDPREPLPPGYFLRSTQLTAPHDSIATLAAQSARGASALDRLESLMHAIGDRIAYRPGTTHARTQAADALALGAGVCQDHAHVFVAACRALGIPARYIGGYFWSGAESGASQASHAWAEALVDDLGWVGFDPANRTLADERHVRVGVGLDYWSAAPIRGIRRGVAEETLSVALDVAAAEAAQ